MKSLLFSILFFFAVFIPQQSDAARLYTSGIEWGTANPYEWVTTSTTTLNQIETTTSVVHSGTYALRATTTNATAFVRMRYRASDAATGIARAYVRVAAYPSTLVTVAQFSDLSFNPGASIRMNTNGTLELWNAQTAQIGSDSSALSLNTWYRIEWTHTNGGAKARIDGVDFASSTVTHTNGDNMQYVELGTNENATIDIYYDDVAVNDYAGASQAGFPGDGNIALLVPTGDGDGNCSSGAGDWANVNELPPSNSATAGGSNICELDVNPTTADFAMTDSSTAGIDSYDTITLVDVIGRLREETAGATNYTLRVKSASGGSTSVSSSQDAGDATSVRTNPSGTTAFGIDHVSYTDPTTAVAWTPTGTNSIDNMQAGAGTTDGTPDTWLATLAVNVEYVNGTAPPAGGGGEEYIIIFGLIIPTLPRDFYAVLRGIFKV